MKNKEKEKKGVKMKNYRYGLRARPFGLGTFPNVERKSYEEFNKRKTGFYCIIETVCPLSEQDIKKYELVDLSS